MTRLAVAAVGEDVGDQDRATGVATSVGAAQAPSGWAALQAVDGDVHGWRTGLVVGATSVVKIVLEAALEAEMVEHLGYSRYDQAGRQLGSNSRNGTRAKRVLSWFGPLEVDIPRDRLGTFQPLTVGKWQRRAGGLDRLVLPLAANGAQDADSVELLSRVYRGSASRGLLAEIASTVRQKMNPWHHRSLQEGYPVLLLNRVVVRSRHAALLSQPVHTAVGVTGDGRRELLGLWSARNQTTAERWKEIGTELKTRGLSEVDGVVCDAIPGLGPDLQSIWPDLDVRQRS